MTVSVLNPISDALNRTKLVLFQPFDIGKWFILGFCAFLAYLFESGGGGGSGYQGPQGGGQGGQWGNISGQDVISWIQSNLSLIIIIGVSVLIVIVALTALITWIKSRGTFMFIDGIVLNRAAVVEPWKAFRDLGNSLFGFWFFLGIIGVISAFLSIAIGLAIAWPDIAASEFGASAILGIVIGAGLIVVISIILAIVKVLLIDFVAPTMYLRGVHVMDAWPIVGRELLADRVGTIVLYFLVKILIAVVIGLIAFFATCLTCCIAAIPYIGTVILLPLYVFHRSYSLCFIEQYGPDWGVFLHDSVLTKCDNCGYDLRGLIGPGVCPECGSPFGSVPTDDL